MLTRLWLWIGRLLGRLLLAVSAVGLAGWAIAAVHFHFTHRGPVSSEEVIAPSEAGDTRAIIADAIAVVEQHSENTRVLRDAHAKPTAACAPRSVCARTYSPHCAGRFQRTGQDRQACGKAIQRQRLSAVRPHPGRAWYGDRYSTCPGKAHA